MIHRLCNILEVWFWKDMIFSRIRVQAVNHVGIGGFSPVLKATTEPQRPPAPVAPELIQATHNSLKLRWGMMGNTQHIEYCLQMKSPDKTR